MGKIRRLIRNKLGPKAIYFTLNERVADETMVNLETEILGIGGKTRIRGQTLQILKDARIVAKERIGGKPSHVRASATKEVASYFSVVIVRLRKLNVKDSRSLLHSNWEHQGDGRSCC